MISVVVADDDADWRSVLVMMLDAYPKLNVIAEAADGDAAIECALIHRPEVMFLDIDMPGQSGLDVAGKLQVLDPMPYIVFVTARREHAIEAFDLEASDYLVKPVQNDRLDKCVARLIERVTAERQNQETKELEMRVEKLEVASMTDPLLKIYNRRYMDERLRAAVQDADKRGSDLTCLMLDLDHFKSVNDTHGHQVGDLVLVQLCEVIKGRLRPNDILARYGGEEFLVLLHESNQDTASAVAERIRAAIEKNPFGRQDTPLKLTASLGGAVFKRGDNSDTLVERADQALYDAKRNGRNQALLV